MAPDGDTADSREDDDGVGRTVIWRFVDGKPGHEKQSAGLIQGIESIRPIEVHEIDVRFKAFFWRQVFCGLRRETPDLPEPDLLIGVGHRTHLPLLIARIAFGGQTVVLMRPSLPYSCFDLVFVPAHDRVRRKANVIETRGVICPAVVWRQGTGHRTHPARRHQPALPLVQSRCLPQGRCHRCDIARCPLAGLRFASDTLGLAGSPAGRPQSDLPSLGRRCRRASWQSHFPKPNTPGSPPTAHRCSTNRCRLGRGLASSTWNRKAGATSTYAPFKSSWLKDRSPPRRAPIGSAPATHRASFPRTNVAQRSLSTDCLPALLAMSYLKTSGGTSARR